MFSIDYVDECYNDELDRVLTPATTLTYEIKAAGSTPADASWFSNIKPKTLTRCRSELDAFVEMEIAGQWVEIWSWDVDSDTKGPNGNKPAWLTVSRDATATSSAKVKFSI